MTIQGAVRMGTDHCIVWSDTEIYMGENPRRVWHEPKLTLNPLAAAVGCGRGLSKILDDADAVVREASRFEGLEENVMRALRESLPRNEKLFESGKSRAPEYLLAGWSTAANSMLIWSFDIGNYYVPRLESQYLSPWIDRVEMWRPTGLDVIEAAREQVVEFQNHVPGANTGALCIADIRPGYVAARAIPDFDVAAKPQERETCS